MTIPPLEGFQSPAEREPDLLPRRRALQLCLAAPASVVALSWLEGCSSENSSPASGDSSGSTTPPDGASTNIGTGQPGGDSGATPAGPEAGAPGSTGLPGSADAAAQTPVVDAGTRPAMSDAAGQVADAAPASDASQGPTDAEVADVPWASGGTGAMQGGYPDPFSIGAMGAACAVYPSQTLGPCYASPVAVREDISDGQTGLPVRLSLLVLDQDGCTPLPNVEVDIWHTGSVGVYSQLRSRICNPDGLDVVDETFCRGRGDTDENGRVNFSTIYPGWYSGRAIHIHFTVRAGGREYKTSQLYFEEALSDEIAREHVDYSSRGAPNTTNSRDSVLRGTPLDQVLLSTAKRADGALHAWKVLTVQT